MQNPGIESGTSKYSTQCPYLLKYYDSQICRLEVIRFRLSSTYINSCRNMFIKTIPFVKIVKLSGHFGHGFHCQTVLFGKVVEEIAIISITAYTFILFIVFFVSKVNL